MGKYRKLSEKMYSVLFIANSTGDLETVLMFLQIGVDPNNHSFYDWTPLHCATWHNQPAVVRLLIGVGANPGAENSFGDTPLLLANLEIANILLIAGANPNIKNKYGKTPLDYIGSDGDKDIVRLLLDYGAGL